MKLHLHFVDMDDLNSPNYLLAYTSDQVPARRDKVTIGIDDRRFVGEVENITWNYDHRKTLDVNVVIYCRGKYT